MLKITTALIIFNLLNTLAAAQRAAETDRLQGNTGFYCVLSDGGSTAFLSARYALAANIEPDHLFPLCKR